MAENKPAWYWRAYDHFERAVVGGVWGWCSTIPVMWLFGIFGDEYGMNGWAGDYAWYGTIPLGVILWSYLRRGRAGGWISRAFFGAALGLPVGLIAIVFSGAWGEAIFGVYLLSIPACMAAWPLLLHFVYPRPEPEEKK
ncbi:MAG: hypothetical protein PHV33_12755 [Elusimicrobiales bacterium]|nr:hypothetical protein [Elusimicrobiales bacterium]